MEKTAILLGATGLTGGVLLHRLLDDPDFGRVIVFTRRTTGVLHPKLEEHIVDLLRLDLVKKEIRGEVIFCCIGTTKAKTPNKKLYAKIDYGIPVQAGKIAAENGIQSFIVISALGSNPKSRIFYNYLKGRMEEALLLLPIPHLQILRRSLIGGKRKEKRTAENISKFVMGALDFIIPTKYKMVTPQEIAKTMIHLAKHPSQHTIITNTMIKNLGKKPKFEGGRLKAESITNYGKINFN